MKILDKIALILFSGIILILSLCSCLIVFGWIDLNSVYTIITNGLNNTTVVNVTLGISVVLMLLAIKVIFFYSEDEMSEGLKLENTDGNLLISKDTIENLVNSVAKGFENTENVTTRIGLDKQNQLVVDVLLHVLPNTVIKEMSANLQTRIKEVIKSTTDLEVKQVNIKIKNVAKTNNNKIVTD